MASGVASIYAVAMILSGTEQSVGLTGAERLRLAYLNSSCSIALFLRQRSSSSSAICSYTAWSDYSD
jgi:hypothetical protein